MNELIGRQIEHYRIEALLGEGGMGSVYRAYDLNLARPVAFKVMNPQLTRQREFRQRFLQEARAAARLNDHPSIVTIHHFGESQGMLFMVMALVYGGSLSAHVDRLQKTGEAISLREILALLAQSADALGYAHRKGVLHRDIKPSNILVQRLETPDREGDPPLRAILTDFGLAKLREGGLETRSGDLMGTYAYMSPEQSLQKELNGRSDIYSLGVVLYQLTTGRLPFEIHTATEAVMKHLHEIPPAPRVVCEDLPPMIETIILKAIAKQPEERFQTAEEVAQALREAAKRITVADVTRYTGKRPVLSLETHLKQSGPEQEPSRMGFDISAIPSKDRLVIAQKDHTPRTVPLDKQQLTIGRSAENDIVLDHPDVSRQHARLEHSLAGWQVTDLKSTNGTYLDGNLLLAGVKEPFLPGKTLRIGPYYLHWQGAGTSIGVPSTLSYRSGVGRSVPPNTTHLQSRAGQIDVTVRPTTVEVLPGERANVQVELFNQGALVDQFRLSVVDLPPEWVTIPQAQVDLLPGGSSTLEIQILPPKSSTAQAKTYPFKLVVESQAVPGETVAVPGQLIIKPFDTFTMDMQPTTLADGSSSRVSIRNEGNIDETFSLTGRDPANQVLFDGGQARIRVPPGQTVVRPLSVRSMQRPFIGNKRILPFEVQISSSKGAKKRGAGPVGSAAFAPILDLAAGWDLAVPVPGG